MKMCLSLKNSYFGYVRFVSDLQLLWTTRTYVGTDFDQKDDVLDYKVENELGKNRFKDIEREFSGLIM